MKLPFFIIVLLVLLTSYREGNTIELENEKYLNFVAAIENHSTVSYFTVVKIKNLNNNQIKEVCTKGNFLMGALHREMGLGYDTASQRKVLEFAKSKKNRYFELKNKKALQNISFFDYNAKLINDVKNEYNLNKVIDLIEENKDFAIWLGRDKNKAFAHVMFNSGIMMAENSCVGGTIYYVDRNCKD